MTEVHKDLNKDWDQRRNMFRVEISNEKDLFDDEQK